MKRVLRMLLTLFLLFGVVGLFDVFSGPPAMAEENNSKDMDPAGKSYEGPGYDTPKEAVLAYLNAFNTNDVDRMLSTFAIESWVDHKDTFGYLGVRDFIDIEDVPVTGGYSRAIQIAMRRWDLAIDLYEEYLEVLAKSGMLAGGDKALIEAEKAAFEAQLAAHRAALEMEVSDAVPEQIAGLLMGKTAEICYERHTAPEDRAPTSEALPAASLKRSYFIA